MWVLVTILMHQGNIKVNSFNGVFMERASCVQLGARIEEELMKTRPTPESIAKSYAFRFQSEYNTVYERRAIWLSGI